VDYSDEQSARVAVINPDSKGTFSTRVGLGGISSGTHKIVANQGFLYKETEFVIKSTQPVDYSIMSELKNVEDRVTGSMTVIRSESGEFDSGMSDYLEDVEVFDFGFVSNSLVPKIGHVSLTGFTTGVGVNNSFIIWLSFTEEDLYELKFAEITENGAFNYQFDTWQFSIFADVAAPPATIKWAYTTFANNY